MSIVSIPKHNTKESSANTDVHKHKHFSREAGSNTLAVYETLSAIFFNKVGWIDFVKSEAIGTYLSTD